MFTNSVLKKLAEPYFIVDRNCSPDGESDIIWGVVSDSGDYSKDKYVLELHFNYKDSGKRFKLVAISFNKKVSKLMMDSLNPIMDDIVNAIYNNIKTIEYSSKDLYLFKSLLKYVKKYTDFDNFLVLDKVIFRNFIQYVF